LKVIRIFLVLVIGFSLCGTGVGQEIPFLDEDEYSWLVNEISGDAAYEHIRYFTQFHRPRGGAPGLMKVARYVEEKVREYGLQDVQLIRQDSNSVPWGGQLGELWLTSPERKRVASTVWHPLYLSDYSRTTDIDEAELVFVGAGTNAKDYEGIQVEGKIVLAHGSGRAVMRQAVWERGALGIVTYPNPRIPDYPMNSMIRPNQLKWSSIPAEGRDGQKGTFGFQLSSRQGLELTNLVKRETVKAKVKVRSSFGTDKWQVMVEAFIRGTGSKKEDIVVTAHLQEEKYSANDDASGCANVLEIARALQKLIKSGRIARPERNIRFWWLTEIGSQRQYFSDNPTAHKEMFANINQDMVGANQSQGVMRVQNMTRVPFSRFHFLNDVAESVLDFVVESNKGNLAVIQAGNSGLYPRPILASLGTRQRYNAEAIPFHNNTDHMTFNEAPIGVPGITFTNWPDNYIHSTDDDLWNIDRTQLQRNAFAVAMISYVMASAGDRTFGQIASEVGGRGLERIAEDYRLATLWVSESKESFFKSSHQIDQAVKRELSAVDSLQALAANPSQFSRIGAIRKQLEGTGKALQAALLETAGFPSGVGPDEEALTEAEEKLLGVTPKLVGGPTEFLTGRRGLRSGGGLHPLMAFETLCFVDGTRSGLEIYRAVAAEARRGGKHYYGEVSPESVLGYLEKARGTQLIDF
jgi:hypothetical protein